MKKLLLLIIGCISACFIGGTFRFAQAGVEYLKRSDSIIKAEDHWNRELAKCESIIIENGDSCCYDTFHLSYIQKTDGLGLLDRRRQLLPSLIMANHYSYKYAFAPMYYWTTAEYSRIKKLDTLNSDGDKLACYLVYDFLVRGLYAGDPHCGDILLKLSQEGILFANSTSTKTKINDKVKSLYEKNDSLVKIGLLKPYK